jgi:hypothetical protein
MKKQAIEKIKQTPKITDELKYGGCLMFDENTCDIFYCNDDDKTYYKKWSNSSNRFNLIEWRLGGLNKYDLKIIDKYEYQVE